MLIVSPVRGLRPERAARSRPANVPKPTRGTWSPCFKAAVMDSTTAATARLAAALGRSAACATASISSDLCFTFDRIGFLLQASRRPALGIHSDRRRYQYDTSASYPSFPEVAGQAPCKLGQANPPSLPRYGRIWLQQCLYDICRRYKNRRLLEVASRRHHFYSSRSARLSTTSMRPNLARLLALRSLGPLPLRHPIADRSRWRSQCNIQYFIYPTHRANIQLSFNIFGNISQILTILFRNKHYGNTASKRCQQFLFEPANWQHFASQRNFPRHCDISTHRDTG